MLIARRSRRAALSRGGFTAIEVLVVLAVLAVLAAVVVRNVASTTESGRTAGLAQSLDALRQSVYAYRADVRRYPTNLSQLSTPPTSATDLCGRNVPPAFLDEWRGPYTVQTITANGVTVGDALILDTLVGPVGQGIEDSGTLHMLAIRVDSTIAARLERAYDGEPLSYGDGVIEWSSAGEDTLKFGLDIRGC